MKIAHIANSESDQNNERILPKKFNEHFLIYWGLANSVFCFIWLLINLLQKKQRGYKYTLSKKEKKHF